jgi:hypothetical protein
MLKAGGTSNNHWAFKLLKLGVIHMANFMANSESYHEISYIMKTGRFNPTGILYGTLRYKAHPII